MPDQARIGCAAWNIPREAAHHFPFGPSHLERYALAFNACEINSSFYRPHKLETWERWGKSVPDNFRFSVKAPRTITHESALECGSELLLPFLHQVSFLNEKLGPILFQFPPSLEYAPVRVRRFLSSLREIYPGDVVWEPRHPSWFADEVDLLLQEFHIARVAADPACVPPAAAPGGWPSLTYFRLHGSPRLYYSAYSNDFLGALASKIASLALQSRVWCIFDNTAAGHAIPNAAALRNRLDMIQPQQFVPMTRVIPAL
jgi:uncharacterized protein YecE (DUF72 family)